MRGNVEDAWKNSTQKTPQPRPICSRGCVIVLVSNYQSKIIYSQLTIYGVRVDGFT